MILKAKCGLRFSANKCLTIWSSRVFKNRPICNHFFESGNIAVYWKPELSVLKSKFGRFVMTNLIVKLGKGKLKHLECSFNSPSELSPSLLKSSLFHILGLKSKFSFWLFVTIIVFTFFVTIIVSLKCFTKTNSMSRISYSNEVPQSNEVSPVIINIGHRWNTVIRSSPFYKNVILFAFHNSNTFLLNFIM